MAYTFTTSRTKNEQEYEPKRIAHFPDDAIDIIVSSTGATAVHATIGDSTLSSNAIAPTPSHSLTSSSTSPKLALSQTLSLARPMTLLSTMASDITHIQHQLDRSSDQHSACHQQLLERLVQLLQEHAEAKERDERVLAELAAAKERDEEIHRLQKQTIDRLVVAQQRIEAILVQNYELHEYPIPRLFVILPDSYERWDPRNVLMERFRLHFLCECGDHCDTNTASPSSSGHLRIPSATSSTPIPVKNSIHLAKHEGYELSHPSEFFDRYGPYVLGILRILKHCLAVATVVAPAVALAENSVKDVMDGIRSVSESTIMAVDMSIDFLEQKLDGDGADNGPTRNKTRADLRRLDTFLRKKDADKILGNLYRITTETGHVKWVCLYHYQQVYRDSAMKSFLQSVETNNGTYDPQLGKATVVLKSSMAAKDLLSRLSQQAPAVTTLKVSFNWSFGASDLIMLVGKVGQSNIRNLELHLEQEGTLSSLAVALLPGKGKYHSLLDLIFSKKIKSIAFSHLDLVGIETSSLPSRHSPSLLQSFHYLRMIHSTIEPSLADIISHCPHLVDLRLGSAIHFSFGVPTIDRVIGYLSKLETLHRYRLCQESQLTMDDKSSGAPYGSVALRELVDFGMPYPSGPNGLEGAIRQSVATIEVIVLRADTSKHPFDLLSVVDPCLSPTHPNYPAFDKLTHLELLVHLTPVSLERMNTLAPRLALVHIGVNELTSSLLTHINLDFLKSVCLKGPADHVFEPFYSAAVKSTRCQIESLMLSSVIWSPGLADVLSAMPLKRLILDFTFEYHLNIVSCLNLVCLQSLTIIRDIVYNWEHEAALAARRNEFADGFLLQLGYNVFASKRDIHKHRSRDVKGSTTRLSSRHVRIDYDHTLADEHYSAVFPPSFR